MLMLYPQNGDIFDHRFCDVTSPYVLSAVQVVLRQRGRHIECSPAGGIRRGRTDAIPVLGRRSAAQLQHRATVRSRRTIPLSAARRHRKATRSRSENLQLFDDSPPVFCSSWSF